MCSKDELQLPGNIGSRVQSRRAAILQLLDASLKLLAGLCRAGGEPGQDLNLHASWQQYIKRSNPMGMEAGNLLFMKMIERITRVYVAVQI